MEKQLPDAALDAPVVKPAAPAEGPELVMNEMPRVVR